MSGEIQGVQCMFIADETDQKIQYTAVLENVSIAKVESGFEIGLSLRITEYQE